MNTQKDEPRTILLWLFLVVCELQRLSPTEWLPWLITLGRAPSTRILKQNVTDAFVLFRLGTCVALVLMQSSHPWCFWVALVLVTEMLVAYASHFFTDKFNAAGPGRVTSVRRTIIIMTLNFVSFTLLFSVFFQKFNALGAVDATYLSTITITTLGYGDVLPKNDESKLLACLEALLGVFQLAIVFGTIVGWSELRHQSLPADER